MKTLLDIGLANAVMAGVLALGAALICRFCRKPALAHALWLLVLLKLIVPPLWKVPVSDSLSRLFPQSSAPPIVHVMVRPAPEMESTIRPMPSAPKAGAPIDAVKPLDSALLAADRTPRYQFGEASTDPHFPSADAAPLIDPPADPIHHSVEIWRPVSAGNPAIQPWRPQLPSMTAAIIGFWLGGSCLCTFIIIARVIRFRRLLAYAVPATHSVQRRADSLARRMGTSSLPTVWFIPGSVCPMLYALGRKPRLLIPEALWNRLNDNQQSSLLVHELAHLRRGDHRVRVLELLVTILYWWNPVAWWARRELREAEEQCCDAWVVWLMPGSARHYASALLEAVEFVSQQPQDGSRNIRPRPSVPLLASGMGEFHRLRRRLIMIKTTRVTRKLTGMGVTSIVSLAGLLLPLAPTFAQQDPATATPAQEGKSYRVVEVVAGEASGGRGDTVKADERAVIQQLRAQSEALQAQAQIVAQQAQVAARQAQDTAQKAVGDAFNGFAQGGGKPNNPDPRQQMDREIQQARAEVQKLSAALGQATARLKMLEMQTAKMSANGMPNPGGFGGSMSGSGTPTPGGFGGSMSAGGMPSAGGFGGSMSGSGMKGAYPPAPKGGTSSADTVYGHVNVNMTPPSVTFTPGSGGFGGGGMTSIAVPSGTTMVRITPDGKIVETYNGPMNMPSSVEQRLSNLDAQLQMLRDEVQHIRKELHSGQSNGPRSDKGNYPDLKPSVSAAK